ncbi:MULTISPECIES: hypothetical protein [Bacillus]|uniref:hypothetical protein n=1 Tax=Bacillus TaxID=1386 RepID=UPI000260B4A6|nr:MULTISPECIES: hypothetical protein [Bacillus]KML18366.1 hypothetical protein VL09_05780 [Bacillus stratosphericus]MBY0185508.1 hypothetical protein [Bacillus aerophilus]AKU33075.1 hypothetical protein ID12_17190 [Bacillus altitudinis]EIL86178.1 yjcN [Bacillus sp. M 2-6]KML59545.1 hypothetical protein VL19_14605 [Bacillus stratosphericus]
MKTRHKLFSFFILLVVIITLPLLSPMVFTNATERGAIRHAIYQEGYPYQSYFAILQKKDDVDPQYGQLYDVYWQAWKSETGMTPSVCYSKKVEDHEYKVSCGTAP